MLPFVLPLLAGLGAAGSAAGALGGARANARSAEADALTRKYQADVAKYGQDLNRYQLELTTPEQLAKTSLRGNLISGLQDVNIGGHPRANIPQIAGGIKPSSMITPDSRLLGEAMARQALMRQLQGYGPPTGPSEPKYPKASGLDKFLNIVGLAGAGASVPFGAQNILDSYRNNMVPAPSPWGGGGGQYPGGD